MTGGPVLVIGIGNEMAHDDGAGLAVAKRLRATEPAGARVVEQGGEPTSLIETWAGAGEAIVVDAVLSGAEPGTIHRLDPIAAPLPAELFRGSTHHLGLAEAIELARAIDRLPPRLLVYGIEGADFTAGEGLTPAVEHAAREVAAEVEARLSGPGPDTPSDRGEPPG